MRIRDREGKATGRQSGARARKKRERKENIATALRAIPSKRVVMWPRSHDTYVESESNEKDSFVQRA